MGLLRDRLKSLLAQRGAMSVADYMAWCLTERDDAYYRQGSPIGSQGDFITAPEISQIFGELIGVWLASVWRQMGAPAPFHLIELGPGRGTLMSDALRALRVAPGCLEAARIHLVERSETLRAAQEAALAKFAPAWHESLATVPEGPALLIANEFFDALPVQQFVYAGGGWRERVVTADGDALVFAPGRPSALPEASHPPPSPEDGAILEARPSALSVLEILGRRAKQSPLAALVIDYGYERDALGETLQAARRHGYVSPLAYPGESDLSAHVNFAELGRMARACGLSVWGPLQQGAFLQALGLETRLLRLAASADEEQKAKLLLGARRLTDPFQMGQLFKAIALTSLDLPAPPPFIQP